MAKPLMAFLSFQAMIAAAVLWWLASTLAAQTPPIPKFLSTREAMQKVGACKWRDWVYTNPYLVDEMFPEDAAFTHDMNRWCGSAATALPENHS